MQRSSRVVGNRNFSLVCSRPLWRGASRCPEQLSRKPEKLLDRNPHWVQLLHREVFPVPKPRRPNDHLSARPQTLLFPNSSAPRPGPIFTARSVSLPAGPPDPIEPL